MAAPFSQWNGWRTSAKDLIVVREIDQQLRSDWNCNAWNTDGQTEIIVGWCLEDSWSIHLRQIITRNAWNRLGDDWTKCIFFTQNRCERIQLSIHVRWRRQEKIPFSHSISRLARILTELPTTQRNDMLVTGRRWIVYEDDYRRPRTYEKNIS